MKTKFFLWIVMILGLLSTGAQVPQALRYQAVLRNPLDGVYANTNVTIRFTIYDSINPGTPLYRETQSLTTNFIGLFVAQIGYGNTDYGDFIPINWSIGTKYLGIEIHPNGGSNFANLGTSQLISAPYALYAINSDTATYVLNNPGTRAITVDTVFTGLDDISTDVSTTATQLQTGVQTFSKQSAGSTIELYLYSRMPSGTFTGGATGISYWLQIDGNPAKYATPQFLSQSGIIQYISIDATFPGLAAGPHTVSIWAETNAGTSTGIYVDQGGWGGSIMVKEIN